MTNYETVSSKGALGQKIGCITLTKQFYEKNNITNRGNKTLPISFTEFQGLPVQYMNQVHGTSMEEIKESSDEPISNTDALFTKSNKVSSPSPSIAFLIFSSSNSFLRAASASSLLSKYIGEDPIPISIAY